MKNLKHYILLIIYILLIYRPIPIIAQKTKKGLAFIQTDKIKKHINFIASDSLKGRNTPSEGQEIAAKYIIEEFKSYGLKTVNNSYEQHVPIVTLSLGKQNSVSISKDGVTKELLIKSEFIPFEIPADTSVESQIIFAGYGITAPEYNYDDYKDIDVKGKIVLILTHEPGEMNDSSIFNGKHPTQYNNIKYKVVNAINHGAVGMLVISDPLNHLILTPRGYPWPSLLNKAHEDNVVSLKKENTNYRLPVVHVGKEIAQMLLGSVETLQQIQLTIDSTYIPHSFPIENSYAKIQTSVIEKDPGCTNIIGFIPGVDPKLKDEILVIGAHYDHVGYKKNHNPDEDYIFNGADDNASGTTALLSIAEAFGKSKIKTKRSILFLAFTGEEKGLYGSISYVRSPLFPLDKTIALINIDMIGRNSYDTLYIEAAAISPDLTQLTTDANKNIGFQLIKSGNEYLNSSDQAPFYYKNIPFLFVSGGIHPDYHTVRDNPDLINYNKIERVSKLLFLTAIEIANSDKHYTLITDSDEKEN